MKNIIYRLLILILTVGLISCTEDETSPVQTQDSVFSITLNNSTVTSRSEGDDNYNENLIKTVDLFFFAADGTGDYIEYYSLDNQVGVQKEQTIEMSSSNLTIGNEYYVYVIVNFTEASKDDLKKIKTLNALKEVALAQNALGGTGTQSSFVMDGGDKITLAKTNKVIEVKRVASKITLELDVDDEIQIGKSTYKANLGTMKVKMVQGVANAILAATPLESATTLSTEYRGIVEGKNGHIPFYSYPSNWGTTGKNKQCYLELKIEWQNITTGTAAREYTYIIPIGEVTELVRNCHYKIPLYVAKLGSTTSEKTVTLCSMFLIEDWSTKEISTELKKYKYLWVKEKYVELKNVPTYSIDYASSDPVTITVDYVEYKNYAQPTTRTIKITSTSKKDQNDNNFTGDSNEYAHYKAIPDETDLQAKEIDFEHEILPNTYAYHDIYITIKHTNDATFSEQIHIRQYPAIYIVGQPSNGKVFVNEHYFNGKNDDSYVNVNDDNNNGIGSVSNPSSITGENNATNKNKNQYNVYITALPSSNYLIGDPRSTTGSSLSGINELTNYRPTRTDAVNVIAPIFKIASSYGKTTQMSYEQAVKRCASYQENGYPAGRWRIPTPAEIEFMQQRALNGDIPSLFNGLSSNGSYRAYWAGDGTVYWPGYNDDGEPFGPAAGFYAPGNNYMSKNTHSVRCVYDVWYWGDDKEDTDNPVWSDQL